MRTYTKYLCAVLMVLGVSVNAWGKTYQKVTSLDDLNDGDVIIITNNMGASASGNAMSNTASGNAMGCVSVTATSNKITYTGSSIMELTVRRNTAATPNLFAFWTGSGYLYDDGTNNRLKVNSGSYSDGMASGRDWCWTVALSSGSNPNYCMDIKNNKYTSGTDQPRWIQYNSSAFKSTKTYDTYANACIYKVACTEPTLTLDPSSKTMTFGDNSNTFTITPTTNSSGTKSWTSSNTSVATVNSSGVVTVVAAGTSTIKCKVAEYTSGGTTYCEKEVSFSLTVNPACPTLEKGTSTQALTASSITSTTATLSGGIVTYKGGANLTAYGFVYGTSANPTTSNSVANVGTNINVNTAFGSKTITNLSPNTTYYVRVYGTNGCGTRYSPDGTDGYITFTTLQRYTISYDNNGGGGEIDSQTKDHGVTATLSSGANFSKTGYNLSKWNTADDGRGTDYTLGGSYTANANVTMYAVWTPAEYTITLNNQSATSAGSTSITVTYDASTNLTGTPAITVPTKTGYTFGGYYTETGGSGVPIINASGAVIASANDGGSNTYTDASKNWKYANDITLYAKWTANEITLTLSKNGVTGSDGSAKIRFDSIAARPSSITHATNSDATYSLAGYYAEAEKTNKILDASGNVVSGTVSGYITSGQWTCATSPTTLYAKWSKDVYTVTFDKNGHGDDVDAQEVESGEKAIDPGTTNIVDWRFLGWFNASEGGTEWVFSTSTVSKDTTLYAHWEAISYSDDYKAWCDPDITISGDIHLTSVNGVSVYSTSTTSNLLTISSDDLAGVTKLDIKYLDADNADAEVGSSSSLFRLCNNGTVNYNVADGSQIDVSAANTCELSYSISYTPDEYGVINHYKLQVAMKRGSRTVKTVTKDLYGRSLPEEFVVASKFGGEWYALPNTLEATEGASKAVSGVKITVDNTTTPTEALCAPSTTVYQGEGRYAANSNRYGVRLTDGTNHLQVSTTGSNNKMWLSSTGSATCQDWWLSSTDFGAYSVTLPSNTGNTTKKIGMYGGNIGYYESPTSPSGQIYFLPIRNILEEVSASVTEWGQKSVILDVDAQTASSAQAHFGDRDEAEEASSFGQTCTSVAGSASKYNYTLTFSTTDFTSHKGELLYIDWLDAEDEVIGTSTITIPWIIAEDRNMYKYGETTKGPWATEVHVLPGVTLTANTGSYSPSGATINELHIYPGATVNITTGTLTATKLILRNGWTRAGSKRYDVARLYLTPSAGSLKATNVYSDWYVDFDQYYPVAVPWSVTTSGMSYLNSNSAASAGVKMRYYDGASRATNGQTGVGSGANWKQYSVDGKAYPATLTPGIGYAMTARRPTGKAFSIIRMPMTLPSGTWGEGTWTTNSESGYISSTHKDEVEITAHGVSDDSKPRYTVGWNFIANPYMAIYQGAITHSESTTDEYDVEYVNIPDLAFKEYGQYPVGVSGYKLLPSSGFFIQAEETGTLTFGTSNRKASAPSYRKEEKTTSTKQKAYITLNSSKEDDMMGLIVSDKYTAEYEINADLEKLLGDGNSLRTYMLYGGMNMAYVAINETLAREWIPVSVRIPADGEYTFLLHESSVVGELEGVYLIDYGNGDKITNLMDQGYTFASTAGTINGRFAINAIVGEHKTPTAIDAVNAGADLGSDKPFKFLWHDKVYILHRGVIYDSTGKKVKGGAL